MIKLLVHYNKEREEFIKDAKDKNFPSFICAPSDFWASMQHVGENLNGRCATEMVATNRGLEFFCYFENEVDATIVKLLAGGYND